MGETIEARAVLSDKLHFVARAGAGEPVDIDYAPPLGDGAGYRPTELLLASLASCSGQTVISLLRKMGQEVSSFEVTARGERREEHPTVFTSIDLVFTIGGKNVDQAAVEKAIALSEQKYCPVWAMLRPAVPVRSSYRIV